MIFFMKETDEKAYGNIYICKSIHSSSLIVADLQFLYLTKKQKNIMIKTGV